MIRNIVIQELIPYQSHFHGHQVSLESIVCRTSDLYTSIFNIPSPKLTLASRRISSGLWDAGFLCNAKRCHFLLHLSLCWADNISYHSRPHKVLDSLLSLSNLHIGQFKLLAHIIGGVTVAWGVVSVCFIRRRPANSSLANASLLKVLVAIFPCNPIRAYWKTEIRKEAKCIDNAAYIIVFQVTNIIADIIIMILPLPYLWRLRMGLWHKIGLSVTFTLDGLYVASS